MTKYYPTTTKGDYVAAARQVLKQKYRVRVVFKKRPPNIRNRAIDEHMMFLMLEGLDLKEIGKRTGHHAPFVHLRLGVFARRLRRAIMRAEFTITYPNEE